jgi:hypothetical protein
MTNEQINGLKKPFRPNEVKWRISATSDKSGKLRGFAVPYLDSRALQNRLDNVVGRGNWQNTCIAYAAGSNTAFICTISIYNAERKEWIAKSNGAGSTKVEPVKGGISDAFKRTASMWDIGRYLYEFNGVWVDLDQWKNIAQDELKRLESIYNTKVRELFPKPATAPTPQTNQANLPAANSAPQETQIQMLPPRVSAPNYRVISAKMSKGNTILELMDSRGEVFKMFFKGEAKLAQNQQIANAVIHEKESGGIDYLSLESFNLAVNQTSLASQVNQGNESYPQAA